MTATTVAVLHPGQMGAAIAAQLRHNTTVLWHPTGRSDATAHRAAAAGLTATTDLAELLNRAQVVLSICPPVAAEDIATTIAERHYRGIYVDANAISPRRMSRIATRLTAGGATVIDAAIIGPPPVNGAAARIYLASDRTEATAFTAALFAGGTVTPVVLPEPVGTASALKMAYVSSQKAARTLAAVAHALAAHHHVTDHLVAEALRNTTPPLADPDYLPSVAARAWRWAPEMRDVADTLRNAHLPPELAEATAATLQHWANNKDRTLSLDEVLDQLRK